MAGVRSWVVTEVGAFRGLVMGSARVIVGAGVAALVLLVVGALLSGGSMISRTQSPKLAGGGTWAGDAAGTAEVGATGLAGRIGSVRPGGTGGSADAGEVGRCGVTMR